MDDLEYIVPMAILHEFQFKNKFFSNILLNQSNSLPVSMKHIYKHTEVMCGESRKDFMIAL